MMSNADTRTAALFMIENERNRQDEKWGQQDHEPSKWVHILGEEFGEYCEAVNETVFNNGPQAKLKGGYENMLKELTHIAAVAVSAMECLMRSKKSQESTEKPAKLVILETPYAGDVEENIKYARACIRDCLLRGEAPIASHLLYTQPGILDDDIPEERRQGIAAGLAWLKVADMSVIYTDRGISPGMQGGIDAAKAAGVPVEYRRLHKNAEKS